MIKPLNQPSWWCLHVKMHLLARKGEISRRSDIRIQQAVPAMRWLGRTNMSAIHVQDTQNVHPNYGLGIRTTIIQCHTTSCRARI